MKLTKSLKSWQSKGFTKDFTRVFKQEVADLDQKHLPLQQGLSLSSYVSDDKISALINKTEENHSSIIVSAGIFYSGIIAGCSCSDDPTPLDTQNEYCELLFSINKSTAETSVCLITE